MTYTPSFVFENFALDSGAVITPSTEATGYDADNLLIPHPSVKWRSTTGSAGSYVSTSFGAVTHYYDTVAWIQSDFTRHSNLLAETVTIEGEWSITGSGWGSNPFYFLDTVDFAAKFGTSEPHSFDVLSTNAVYTDDTVNMTSIATSTAGPALCFSCWVAQEPEADANHGRLILTDGSSTVYVTFNLTTGAYYDKSRTGTGFGAADGDITGGVSESVTVAYSDTSGSADQTFHRCWIKTTDCPDATITARLQIINEAFGTSINSNGAGVYELHFHSPMLESNNKSAMTPTDYPVSDNPGTVIAPGSTSAHGTNWISAFPGNGFLDSPNGLANCVIHGLDPGQYQSLPGRSTSSAIAVRDFYADNAWVEAGAVVIGKAWSPSGAFKQFQIQTSNVTSSQIGTHGGHVYRGSRTPYRKVKMTFDYNSHDDAMEFVRQSRMRGDNTPILFWMEDENGAILKDEWIVYGYLDYAPVVSQIIDKWRVTVQMSEVLG